MKIISFSGKLQSGKTTAAKMLEDALVKEGYRVGRFSFAKALKDEIWENFLKSYNVPREHLDLPEFKESYRALLTWFGTDFMRAIDPDHWVKKVEEHLNFLALTNQYDFVIGDDTRFKNEYKMLNDRGALMLRMTRDNIKTTDHPSETDLDDFSFDLWITNSFVSLDLLKDIVSSSLVNTVHSYFKG